MGSIFAWLRIFGKQFVSREIKNTLDHHLSTAGAAQLAANLDAAAAGLKQGDHQAAADAIADIVLTIH